MQAAARIRLSELSRFIDHPKLPHGINDHLPLGWRARLHPFHPLPVGCDALREPQLLLYVGNPASLNNGTVSFSDVILNLLVSRHGRKLTPFPIDPFGVSSRKLFNGVPGIPIFQDLALSGAHMGEIYVERRRELTCAL